MRRCAVCCSAVMYYGVLAILIGAASFVVMLTPLPSDEP
jgi:hypothetical protein